MAMQPVILYVEDNTENRLLVRRVLQAEGFQVLEAEDAFRAVERIKSTRPDLILMDINMPDVDGYTLTKRLKQLHHLADVPIVAITANVMKGDKERTLAAGCDGYIQKPIDVDNLPNQVNQFLRVRK
jgi:two-component system cell cycle response regulator DivK